MEVYLKADEVMNFSFPTTWKQSFAHESIQYKTANEAMVLKMFFNGEFSKEEQDIGYEIIVVLREFRFATKNQLYRILVRKGYEVSEELLDSFLKKAVRGRYLNAFTLVMYEMKEIPEDAFLIYCLDHGSMWILKHFYDDDIDKVMRSSDAWRSPQQVSESLVITEFFANLLADDMPAVKYFHPGAEFILHGKHLKFSADCCFAKGLGSKNILLETVRSDDLPVRWREKAETKIVPFLYETISESVPDWFWARYFDEQPSLVLVAETQEQAIEASELFCRLSGNVDFRVITDEEILKGFENGVFFRYDAASKELLPTKLKLFSPVKSRRVE